MKRSIAIIAMALLGASLILSMLPGPSISHAPNGPTMSPSSQYNLSGDQYLISVDLFGNASNPTQSFNGATTQYFKYTYEPMPQKMILIVRSPAPSTISVVLNNSYVVENLLVEPSGIVNYSFSTSVTGDQHIYIYVHSTALNTSKAFDYKVNLMTVTQFVDYVNNVHKKVNPSVWNGLTVTEVVMFAGAGAITGPELYDYYRWERARHPTFDRYTVGGVR